MEEKILKNWKINDSLVWMFSSVSRLVGRRAKMNTQKWQKWEKEERKADKWKQRNVEEEEAKSKKKNEKMKSKHENVYEQNNKCMVKSTLTLCI